MSDAIREAIELQDAQAICDEYSHYPRLEMAKEILCLRAKVEHYERHVIQRTPDMPGWADVWCKGKSYCIWRGDGRDHGKWPFPHDEETPDLRPDWTEGTLAIVPVMEDG